MLSKLSVIVCVFAMLASCKTISQVAEEILEVDKDILQEIRRHSDVRDPDSWRTAQRAAGDSRRSDVVSDIFLKDEQEALADYETIIEILRKPRIPHTRRVSIIYQLISVRCCALLYSKFSIYVAIQYFYFQIAFILLCFRLAFIWALPTIFNGRAAGPPVIWCRFRVWR